MSNDRKQFAEEKIEKILDKLPTNEAVDIWRTQGEKLHQRIVKEQDYANKKATELLKSLNKEN